MQYRQRRKINKGNFFFHLPLDHGTGRNDLLGSLVRVLGEVLIEELGELGHLILERSGRGPGVLGIEELGRDAGAGLRNVQVEDVVGLVVGLGKVAAVDGVEDGPGVLERATLAAGGGAGADPTGVEEPGVGLVGGDLVGEHASVAHGVQSQEGLGEARREGRLRLGHAVLGTGHLGRVAGDEVEHGLLGGELGDGREDTASVAGKEDDVARVVVALAGELGVLDVLDRVGAAGVLSQGGVVVVDDAGDGVEDDVL